ncbi:MAG: PQQ-binding-like beta-propeller repeat protein [Opitutae bacterium]|nr:PQQ-binding-like beta-propeller repeat protein [Opitutae bacterium]
MKCLTLLLIPLLLVAGPVNWPTFRGVGAKGFADNVDLPEQFEGTTGKGIRFKVRIPGLAHSSPVVWGEKLFLTTAISQNPKANFKPSLYGSGDASTDRSEHKWKVICLSKNTGKILWERTACQGNPIDKRHIKSTYANSTPATDGRHVIAFFGSQGLYAYNTEGVLLWQKDLGRMDIGAYDLPGYEWGSASSPILHEGKVIVQCDTQGKDFLMAMDAETGKTLWYTSRNELPSWSSPTVINAENHREIVTNGSNFIMGYDVETGKENWRLGGSSKITAPTPVNADGITIVASGRAPESPIFAIRNGSKGNITLEQKENRNHSVAWRHNRRGPYMPTPLIYRGIVYILHNEGIFAAYDLKNGTEHFIKRIPHKGHGFSASPVAADGQIFLPGEDGTILKMKAGKHYHLLSTHEMGEPLMASPAISGNTLFLRGRDHLFAVGKPSP